MFSTQDSTARTGGSGLSEVKNGKICAGHSDGLHEISRTWTSEIQICCFLIIS